MNDAQFIFGTKPIIEAIEAGKNIDKLFIQKGAQNESIKLIIKYCAQFKIPYNVVPEQKLSRITKKNHQGVICFLSPIDFGSIENIIDECYANGKDPLVIILDQISDVRNFGAIARSAECFGVDAILNPFKGASAINADAMKTSAGALNHIPVCRVFEFKETIEYLSNSGLKIIGCSEKGNETILTALFTGPIGLVMGSEEKGISEEILNLCHHKVTIPIEGKVGSLNVSNAASVFLYECIRQRSW